MCGLCASVWVSGQPQVIHQYLFSPDVSQIRTTLRVILGRSVAIPFQAIDSTTVSDLMRTAGKVAQGMILWDIAVDRYLSDHPADALSTKLPSMMHVASLNLSADCAAFSDEASLKHSVGFRRVRVHLLLADES